MRFNLMGVTIVNFNVNKNVLIVNLGNALNVKLDMRILTLFAMNNVIIKLLHLMNYVMMVI